MGGTTAKDWIARVLRGVVGACLLPLCAACGSSPSAKAAAIPDTPPKRIVSLAPSITETLFALGLGESVAGVTSDCAFPPEAQAIPRVGNFLNTSAEAVVALEPDLVLFPSTQEDLRAQLSGLGLRCIRVDQYTVPDILRSIRDLGQLGGVPERAQALVTDIEARLDRVRVSAQGLSRPRVLVVVGRDYSAPALDQVYVAAANSFYGSLVELAGGANAHDESAFPYPMLSAEGLMQLRPEVIVEVIHDRAERGIDPETVRNAWKELPELPAVKAGRIEILEGAQVGIPGPRVAGLVEDLAKRLHPEARAL